MVEVDSSKPRRALRPEVLFSGHQQIGPLKLKLPNKFSGSSIAARSGLFTAPKSVIVKPSPSSVLRFVGTLKLALPMPKRRTSIALHKEPRN